MKLENERSFSEYVEKVLLQRVTCTDVVFNSYCKNSSKATAGNKRWKGIEVRLLRTLSFYKIGRSY